MTLRERWGALSRRRRRTLVVAAVVGIYAVAGFCVVPAVLRAKVPALLADTLGRPVTIENIALNPFALTLTVTGFRIDDTDGQPFVKLGELFVNVQSSSIFRRALTLEQVRLTSPRIRLRLLSDGRLSFADIQERLAAGPQEQPSPPSEPFPLIIRHARIERGGIAFRDESRPTPFEEEVSPIDIALDDFTTRGESAADSPYSFSATTETGATLTWQGTLSVAPLRSSGEIKLVNFRSRTPWRYLRDDLHFEITSGWADVSAKYDLDATAKAPQVRISDAVASIHDVTLFEEGATSPLVILPSLTAAGGTLDLSARTARIGSVTSSGARVRSLRAADGAFRIEKVFATRDSGGHTEPPPPAADDKPWAVTIDSIRITDYGVAFEDRTTPSPAELSIAPISLEVVHLSTADAEPASLNLAVGFERDGRLEATGTISPRDAAADLSVKLSNFALPLVQPYVDAASGATLRDGRLSFDLAISHGKPEAGGATRCDGRIAVSALNVGTRAGADVVQLDALAVDGLKILVDPLDVSVEKIRLERPSLNVDRRADGTTNFADAATRASAPTDAAEPAAGSPANAAPSSAPPNFRLDRIEIVDGTVTVKDAGVSPGFALAVNELQASATGISLDPSARINFDLRAKIERTSSLTISAVANPRTEPMDAKIALDLVGLDTAVFSPYSGKYIGQQIARGKLNLALDYDVAHSNLEADNEVRLDGFTLGKKVTSPDAADLPIGLAIALLKDTRGRIDLDVPVSGRLDDPGFRLGGVVIQTLRNLILKAATAPFALIGGLVGGGDELGRVEFPPGRADLAEPEQAKLAQLARALDERPVLRLEVPGASSPPVDTPAIREIALDDQLKAMRFAELRGKSSAPPGPADVALDDDLRERLIAELYPLRLAQRVKDLRATAPKTDPTGGEIDAGEWTRAEMRRRLLESMPAGPAELADLARRRAEAIVRHLIEKAGVAAARVSVVSANLAAPGEQSGVPVDLVLTAG